MSLVVLCPTRGRPSASCELQDSFTKTRMLEDTRLIFVVDRDDEDMPNYISHDKLSIMSVEHAGGMVNALNAAAVRMLEKQPDTAILGFVGDDHRFRTRGWDVSFSIQLLQNRPGFAYANDLFWRNGEIPTQVFVTAEVIRELGWFGLPGCNHLYIDNAWRELGSATESLYFFPQLVIEHMHPAAGKSEWTAGHLRVNQPENYHHDEAVFIKWRESSQFTEDVERVKRAFARVSVA